MPASLEQSALRLRRFLASSASDKLFLVRCLGAVAAVRIGLSALSYRRVKRWINQAIAAAPAGVEESRRVAWGVRNASRLVPRASCLTQAIAAQMLLARSGHGSTIRVGVTSDAKGRLLAHAWLISGGKIVIGGRSRDLRRYTTLTDLGNRSS